MIKFNVHGEEGIVGVRTFHPLLPAWGDFPMHRLGQEDQNNFLTDQLDVEVLAYFWS